MQWQAVYEGYSKILRIKGNKVGSDSSELKEA